MKLYHSLTFVLLAISVTCFAQKDTVRIPKPDNSSTKVRNVKNGIYVSGGFGVSTILYRIYYEAYQPYNTGYGISQSAVSNGTIEYRYNRISLGAGIAYQTATGVPYTGTSNQTQFSEDLTRLNISGRILVYIYYTNKVEVYGGLRVGRSYWTDVISGPPHYVGTLPPLTMGNNTYTSVQIPTGARFFVDGHTGLHIEVGIGTPYFVEAGVTIKITGK